jgi:hypothetical protein
MSTFQYPGSGLADQHRRSLLEEADGYRLIRLARGGHPRRAVPRPATRPWLAAMKRAVTVQFRPIRAEDERGRAAAARAPAGEPVVVERYEDRVSYLVDLVRSR